MRILVVTTQRAVLGGTETYLREALPALRARGHELALAYNYSLPGQPLIDDLLDLPAWECGAALPEAALRWRPDVCYHQMSDVPELDEFVVSRMRTVLFAHGYYASCASGVKCNGWSSVSPCTRKLSLACLPLNYALRCGYRHPLRLWDNYRKQARRIGLLPRFHRVLTASHHMAGEMRKHGTPADRVVVAPLFPTGTRPGPTPPARRPLTGRILFTGRFTDVKGGDVLVRAAQAAGEQLGRRLTVVFAGSGPEEGPWKSLAARLDVSAEFLGWRTQAELADLRAGADLFAVPSLWPEPFGLVGLEAGCEGLPTVGFAVGGIPDWLIPGVSGESSARATPAGLADAITRALSEEGHHHRLRVGAWETARRFTRERHLEILERALADDLPPGPAPCSTR